MIKNVFIFTIIGLSLFSCSKEEGEGGRSSISGTITGTETEASRSETTVITTIPGAEIKHQDFFLLNTPGTNDNYAIWFRSVTDFIAAPNFTNRTLIQIDYNKISSSNVAIATSIENALNNIASSPFTVSRLNDILTITVNQKGAVTDADNGISKLIVDVTVQGRNKITVQNGAFADEDVYIVYGDDDDIFDDNTKTNYDGTFKFTNLRKGAYKVFAYSKDESSTSTPLTPVFSTIEIGGNEDANIGTIAIEKK